MPKVVILGANGFLGLLIANAFEAKDWEVIALSHTKRIESF